MRKTTSWIISLLLLTTITRAAWTNEEISGPLKALGVGAKSSAAVVNPVLRSPLSDWLSMDGEWEFRVDPNLTGYEARWYETAGWPGAERRINVPGCWEAQGVGQPGRSNEGTAGFETYGHKMFSNYGGAAWYRKTIDVPAKWSGRRIWLKIGGINCIGWIWVNGTYLARHYEYAGTYKYDISSLVTAGQSATVTVLVRNDIPSRQGEVNSLRAYGGLHRSVELEATGDVFVEYAYVEGEFDAKSAQVHASIRSTASGSRKLNVEVQLATLKGEAAGDAGKTITVDGGATVEIVFDVPLKPFQAWSPEQPNLYRAEIVLSDGRKAVHGWTERFGVKKLETRNKQFWLNNRPYFLRGYGDDHTYPLTVCSPADHKTHLKHISVARDFGFNFVRHHTHVELPEYFEAADELGLLVQSEIPYWAHGKDEEPYPHVTHMSGGTKDPPADLRTLIKHFRRYVSQSFYCGGNEGHYSRALGQQLYDIIKELDPSRPWMGQERDTNMGDSVSDYQCYSRAGSGDAFVVPLLENEDNWPMVKHEYLSFSAGDDPRLEPKYGTGYAPNWTMDAARAMVKKAGLEWDQAARCFDAGFRLQSIFHKIGLESARLDPRVDGYSMWLLVDFPPATWNGLLNIFHEPKHSTADYFSTFNQPVVLLAKDPDPKPGIFLKGFPAVAGDYVFDEDKAKQHLSTNYGFLRPMLNLFDDWPLYRAGQEVPVEWVVSNFGDTPIRNAKLTWRLRDGRKVLAEDTLSNVTVEIGDVATVTKTEIALPEVTKPMKATVEVSLTGGERANSWDIWVFPELQKKADLGEALVVGEGIYDLLSKRYSNVVRIGDKDAQDAQVFITDGDGDAIVEALREGRRVLCLSLPKSRAFKVSPRLGNWLWGEQAGTVLSADTGAFGDYPNEGYMNQPYFRVLNQAVKLEPGGFAEGAESLMVGWGNAGFFTCVFEANAGDGKVLVSGLDLTDRTADLPESAYLLDQMIRYVVSNEFSPVRRIDPGIFRGMVDSKAILRELNGVERIAKSVASQEYNSGVFGVLRGHFVRQTDGKGMLTWRTKPLTEADMNSAGDAVFRWPASTGWFTEPGGGHFTLFLNGEELLKFDVSSETKTWQMLDLRGVLNYDVMGFTRPDKLDSVGIMRLTLPAGTVQVGESVEIGVKGSASGSKRFFMLYETR